MISPKSLMKIATTASVVAMTVSVAVVPAYAMQDIAIEDAPSSFAATVDDAQNSSNSMPDNPNATLPETVSENISDDSTVVSENLAVTPEGDVQNIETGETVTDETLVGTQDQQPDPLAKTDGESFIPVSASDVKDAVGTICETIRGAIVLKKRSHREACQIRWQRLRRALGNLQQHEGFLRL